MVGAPLKGRIVIIDDVMTSGKAIREAIDIIDKHPDATLVGIVQLVDRAERGKGDDGRGTVQEVEDEFKVPVEAIVNVEDIMRYLEKKGGMDQQLEEMRAYREQYGVAR